MPTLLARNAEILVTMDGQRRELKSAGIYAEDGLEWGFACHGGRGD